MQNCTIGPFLLYILLFTAQNTLSLLVTITSEFVECLRAILMALHKVYSFLRVFAGVAQPAVINRIEGKQV